MFDLQGKLQQGAQIIDAQEKFDPEERAQYMNASEALFCIRRQWYDKFADGEGKPQDWGFARRGTLIEPFKVAQLKSAGVDIRFTGDDQETIYSDRLKLSATPDGVIVTNQELWGVEFKSIDPRVNRGNLPKKGHAEQLQSGMALVDLVKVDMGLPDLPFAGGFIVYTDASNVYDDVVKPVPFVPGILDKLHKRARRLFNARRADDLPREGKLEGGYECKTYCPWAKDCLKDGAGPETKGSAEGKATRLAKAVTEYVDQAAAEKAAKAMKDNAAERIKAAMASRGEKSLTVGDHTVTVAKVAGRKTFDRKAAEAAGLDLSPYDKVGAPSERLTVK